MYISNNSNSNIGMATVLQQQQQQQQTQTQKNLMKTLTNGNNSEATGNHGKPWIWQNQFENATLNMHYGMKSQQQHQQQQQQPQQQQQQQQQPQQQQQQVTPTAVHPTSHVIAANNTPSNYNHHHHHNAHQQQQLQQQQHAVQTANSNNSFNSNNNNNSSTTSTNNNNINNNTNNSVPVNNATVAAATTAGAAGAAAAAVNAEAEEEPEIDIMINNVVCSFSVRCHLNLRDIAQNGFNVEYRRENGMVTMKLRRPYTTASIWSSGRITCTGATSEDQAKVAARRYARCLEKLGFRVRFHNFRVVNVLGTCSMPWAIKIVNFSEKYKKEASYEPELHPGVTYKLRTPKATLKIFSTGSITVTASCVANVQAAIEHIFPLVYEFRKERTPEEKLALQHKKGLLAAANAAANAPKIDEEDEEIDNDSDNEIEEDNDEDDDDNDNDDAVVNLHSPKVVGSGSGSGSVGVGVGINKLKGKRPFAQHSAPNMNQKKRLLNGGGYVLNAVADNDIEEDADEPSDSGTTFRYTEFDNPEDLIEGPDEEDDDDM